MTALMEAAAGQCLSARAGPIPVAAARPSRPYVGSGSVLSPIVSSVLGQPGILRRRLQSHVAAAAAAAVAPLPVPPPTRSQLQPPWASRVCAVIPTAAGGLWAGADVGRRRLPECGGAARSARRHPRNVGSRGAGRHRRRVTRQQTDGDESKRPETDGAGYRRAQTD